MSRSSRRAFLQRLTVFGSGVVLWNTGCKPTSSPSPRPEPQQKKPAGVMTTSHHTFTNAEYTLVTALVERLLPRDEDPGAQDANVPAYIDRMLAWPELVTMKEDFLEGIDALEKRAQRMFQKPFADATAAQQDELITLFKDSPPVSAEARFYELLLALTLEGFLGDPSYGGNKDKVGWALIGFNTVGHSAVPPPEGHDGHSCLKSCGSHKP